MTINIIYQDENILAVNKPAGLLVHPVREGISETLTGWLVENYPEVQEVGDEPELRPGIVHRLDKETSGVLITARNQKSFEYLKDQFAVAAKRLSRPQQNRKIHPHTNFDSAENSAKNTVKVGVGVKKTYITLARGIIKNNKGIIETPVKRFTKSRSAVTEYKVLKKFEGLSPNEKSYTLLQVSPKTGRTHQIRLHLKSIGHPVVCDKLYSGKKPDCPFGLTRHFLHAQSIELTLPDSGRIKIEADLPDDLEQVLKKLKEYGK